MTKLQQLLEELKGLKRHHLILDMEGEASTMECETGDLVDWADIDSLIAKYTETTPTYKPGDKILITKSCLKTFNGTKAYLVELHSKEEKLWKVEHFSGMCHFSEEEFEPIN